MGKTSRIILIRDIITHQVADQPIPQTAAEIRESNRTSLKAIILLIKGQGEKIELNITEEEIARKLEISTQQLQAYLDGKDNTPDHLPGALFAAYSDLLDTARKKDNSISLKHSVVWIRNCGLAKGLNITVKDMAQAAGISEEQLYGCLNDEYSTPDDLASKLESTYSPLMEKITQVERKEDIDLIKKRPGA